MTSHSDDDVDKGVDNFTPIAKEISLNSSEAFEINLCGAEIVNSSSGNERPPFIVSNRKLGGNPIDNFYRQNVTLPHNHPLLGLVPGEVLRGVYQLQNFLRSAFSVTQHPPLCVKHLKKEIFELRLKLNRHQNNLNLVTAMFEDLNGKASTLMRTVDVSEYVHNNLMDIDACTGAFDRYVEFFRKLMEDMRAEYTLFEKNFNMMQCSVEEQLSRTIHNVHNTVVGLYGRLETLRTLVEQLKTKHEILMNKLKST